jgi:hypothetical protein
MMDQQLLDLNEKLKKHNQQYLKDLKNYGTSKNNLQSPVKVASPISLAIRSHEKSIGTNKKSFNRYLHDSSDSDDEVF